MSVLGRVGQWPLIPGLWRLFLRWRFVLFQCHRHGRVVLEEVAGHPLLVLPTVFNPKLFRSGEFLARSLDASVVPRGSSVLDIGTGSGVNAVVAARWAGRVVAVDINPEAVRCARINVLLNQAEERVEVLNGDLFAPVEGERFDRVLFNPPYYTGEAGDLADLAWRGKDIAERFAVSLAEHLSLGGYVLVVLSTDADEAAFLQRLQSHSFDVEVMAERPLLNETLRIYRARPI